VATATHYFGSHAAPGSLKMRKMAAALAAAAALLVLPAGQASAAILLRYHGQVGQVARYRLSIEATGRQISLGERRPIHVKAELELRQEVINTGPVGTLTMRVNPRILALKDPTGVLVGGERSHLPEIHLQMTPLGEVVAAQASSDEHIGPFQRTFASFISAAGLVVLPEQAIRVGESWQWEKGGMRQNSKLISIESGKMGLVARIATTATSAIGLAAFSENLGLETSLSGLAAGKHELVLLIDKGIAYCDKGVTFAATRGEISLALPSGVRKFPVASETRVQFDLRLIEIARERSGRD